MSTLNGTEERQQPAVRLMGRDELNIAEFPIALLSAQSSGEVKTICSTRQILLPSGERLDQEWTVTGSDRFGLPLPGDQDVLLTLMKLATDAPLPSPQVPFSRYEVVQILGWPRNGKSLKRVNDAVQRYWSTRIFTRNSFWDKQQKKWTSHDGLSIIDEYKILERPTKGGASRDPLSLSWVRFGQQFFDSLTAGYVKPLDLSTYFGLHLNVTKRLYRYLDKHRYRRSVHAVNLATLAQAHIGFSDSVKERPATIKRALEPAHQELLELGFVKEVAYEKGKDGEWRVLYRFRDVEVEQLSLPGTEQPGDTLVDALVRRGVSPKNARDLVAEKSREYLEDKLEAFDYLLCLGTSKPIQNPAGFLTQAIREDWRIAPPGFVPKREREQRSRVQAEEAARKRDVELEEQQRRDEARQLRESLPAAVLEELRQEALATVQKQFGNSIKIREKSPVVEAYLNGLIRERYPRIT